MGFWDDFGDGLGGFNPFDTLGSAAAKIVADGWIAAWLSIWNAGLWLLRLVLSWSDAWLTPDLSANGPGHDLYQVTFWIAGVLLLIMVMVQLGIAAFRRDGKGLARAGIGLGQFAVIVGGWIGYTVGVTAAFSGLTRATMDSLMGVTSWRDWDLFTPVEAKTVTEGAVAVLLGFLGLLVWLASIGHLVILLIRAATLMVLVATGPIAAAGLAYDGTRVWFWKTFRWFHAAAATPLIVVLVSGAGMKFAEGVVAGKAGSVEQTIGTAVPAIVLICVAIVSPLALFKLLAFTDPGTASGAAMRAGLASLGGMQGLLGGNPTAGVTAGGGDTTGSDGSARTAGEASADEVTTSKAASAAQMGSSLLGPAGMAFAAGLGALMKVGSVGASVMADVTNQEGVGHNSYQPDYLGGGRDGAARANREANGDSTNSPDPDTETPDSPPPDPGPPPPPNPPPAPAPTPGPDGAPGLPAGCGSPGGGAGGSGGSGGAGAAAGTEAAEAAVVVL